MKLSFCRRTALTTLLCLCPLALAAAPDASWNLNRLMQTLAGNPGGRATFTETKHLAVLDAPIESHGELVYVAPARLERHTLAPAAESMVLDGDTITLTRAGKTFKLRLQDYPAAAALIDSIRGTLAGDRRALERTYLLSLSGTREAWTLHLLPSDPALAALVSRIRIDGQAALVRSVEVLQADGDRSVMHIEPLNNNSTQ
jgi:outer membrane lipoprotein-sorting protein